MSLIYGRKSTWAPLGFSPPVVRESVTYCFSSSWESGWAPSPNASSNAWRTYWLAMIDWNIQNLGYCSSGLGRCIVYKGFIRSVTTISHICYERHGTLTIFETAVSTIYKMRRCQHCPRRHVGWSRYVWICLTMSPLGRPLQKIPFHFNSSNIVDRGYSTMQCY